MFIRYLAEQALNVVKSEKKPRRNIQYKDLGKSTHGKALLHASLSSKQMLLLESTVFNFLKT